MLFWLKVAATTASAAFVAATPSIWEEAFDAQPNPGARDLANKDYFVLEVADPAPIAEAHGWVTEEPFPIKNHWLLSAPISSHSMQKRSSDALLHGAFNFYASEPSKLRRRAPIPNNEYGFEAIKREFGIEDPLFKDQWFIYNDQEKGHDMNVLPVWRRNITGNGVTVAIVDDGLEYEHPDFAESFSREGSWDYNLHQQLPKPLLPEDTHGTRCAGEVAAGKNNICGVGVAPGAKVAGIRILSGELSNSDEARALIHRYNVNDIYSCSWGPSDDGMTIDGPPALVKRAEVDGIENGRNGKGSIYVVASGNGDSRGDNCNYDGYTNSIYSITVGAIDRQNGHPYYAESCSANMVVTYSSNYFDKITTTDKLSDNGNPQCTNKHSGTSAAAPIAAGVFALVLEQRPELTWRDLQYLVRDTAKHFDIVTDDPSNPPNRAKGGWMKTADGHLYHNSYGYGLLDADAIVKRAETWELVKPQAWCFLPPINTRHPITPKTSLSIELSRNDWNDANIDRIEHVRVRVSYQHEARGQLSFQLESPAGIVSELAAPREHDNSGLPVTDWEFLSVVHWNETGAGVWRLRIIGPEEMHGVVTSWQLKLFGEAKDPSKTKRYSELWNKYERPADLVTDPFDQEDVQSSTTASVEEPTKTNPADGPSNDDSHSEATMTTSSLATSPASSSTTPADDEASAPTATQGGPEPSKPHATHSILFYIAVSAIGAGVLGLIMVPIIYFGFWRRKSNPSSYVHLADEDFELDEMNDNFEIDDEDIEHIIDEEPEEPAPSNH